MTYKKVLKLNFVSDLSAHGPFQNGLPRTAVTSREIINHTIQAIFLASASFHDYTWTALVLSILFQPASDPTHCGDKVHKYRLTAYITHCNTYCAITWTCRWWWNSNSFTSKILPRSSDYWEALNFTHVSFSISNCSQCGDPTPGALEEHEIIADHQDTLWWWWH